MSRVSVTAVASSASSSTSLHLDSHSHHHHHQDDLWQRNTSSREQVQPGPYPVREGESDCSYYIRTGVCRFGTTCRFNHPPNRKLVIATARMKGEYPKRIGQPECQYYLKTGTCKFGATCKFHHPRDKAGVAGGRVALNTLGYPLHPNEMECAYYMRNGECKFGSTCKFNHPQPMVSLRGEPVYTPPVPVPVRSPTIGQLSFPFSRASLITSPRWQRPSSYTPLFLPQGIVWNTYNGQVGSVPSSENHNDGTSVCQGEAVNVGYQYRSGCLPMGMGYYRSQRENVFPERPGEPECQFYVKTGDCKFGGACKFHHPRERLMPVPDCFLSPIGLPLRPGEALCIFYSRYGICKFGPSCKFDHPMRMFASNASISSSSSPPGGAAVAALSSASDEHVEAGIDIDKQ